MLTAYVNSIFSPPVGVTGNLALNKPVTMSTQYDVNTKASNAVDGNRISSHVLCAITTPSTKGWLRIDLQNRVQVQKVGVKNRIGGYKRLGIFHITVGDSSEDGGITNPYCVQFVTIPAPDQFLFFHCSAIVHGRYVTVFKQNIGILEICEVEVYGIFD